MKYISSWKIPPGTMNAATGVMQPMFTWCETMQHETMHDIFGKSPRNDTAGEKRSVRNPGQPRNC